MKTTITLLFILVTSVTTSLFSQANTTKEYLKATNHLWNSYSYFDDIKDADDPEKERKSLLPLSKQNLVNAKNEFNLLKVKFPNDKGLKKLELWIEGFEGIQNLLNKTYEDVDPSWQLALYLLKIDLQDFVNGK